MCSPEGYEEEQVKFVPVDGIVEVDGINLQCALKPRRFWQCQNCFLMNKCHYGYGQPDWPACQAKDRTDHLDVVFTLPPPVRRRRREEEAEEQ